ncbi:MAG: hypothetical protein NVS3B16_24710 [Vulcanimicrobiaceae bacterium]
MMTDEGMYELQKSLPRETPDDLRKYISEVIVDARASRATIMRLRAWRDELGGAGSWGVERNLEMALAQFDAAIAGPKPKRVRTRK